MSVKLNVSKLRAELARRGLDTTGLKPALVSRLDGAIAEEDVKDTGTSTSVLQQEKEICCENGKSEEKRKRTDVEDAEASKHIKTVEEVSKMTVADLKAALSQRGLASTGVKKDLIQRLSEDLEGPQHGGLKDGDHVADTSEKGKEPEVKMVAAMKKGRAVLDQYLPDEYKKGYHVCEDETDIYDATLNQTNVGDNNNKFYVIQLIQANDGSDMYVYTRWGRVGVKGQDKLFGPFLSLHHARLDFQNKFYDKTKNHWSNRHDFVAYPKKYTWLEMDYESEKDEDIISEKVPEKGMAEAKKPAVEKQSKLEKSLKDLITLICDANMMKDMLNAMGFDTRKMPLGKLSKSTILKGYEVLKKLAVALEEKSMDKRKSMLQQLSSEFYTVIPHDFGFQKMQNFMIDTIVKLKMKLEMVETLGEIELATKLFSNDKEDDDPAYTNYKSLNCEIEPLSTVSHEFHLIKQYMENTRGHYKINLLHIFKIQRDGEAERFQPFSQTPNRMLLWHGSRLSNWTGILSQGLRIAPPEAPHSGYSYGKGVYFADMVCLSAGFCHGSPIALLALSEVALGDIQELYAVDYNASNLPKGKLSSKAVGFTAPNPKECTILEDGVIVPTGEPINANTKRTYAWYNEYIVYNTTQIRMRYLVQVEIKFDHM